MEGGVTRLVSFIDKMAQILPDLLGCFVSITFK